MLLTMKAPANRERGQRTVRCNEAQAEILRKVGWTDVEPEGDTEHIPAVTTVAAHFIAEMGLGSPFDQTIEPEPVSDPDEVRPRAKRTYHRRTVQVEPDGSIKYRGKPATRRYRRRDLKAED